MQEKKPKSSPLIKYARFSAISFQMGATIFLGAYAGKMLDEKYPSNKKWFTIGLTLFAVAMSLYIVLRQVNRLNSEDD
ncbi:MAG: AtpZ/AtpI family protein [Fluviicola sp.]|nr:AtpZ/AtpI family protein [Fluviicola sp.]